MKFTVYMLRTSSNTLYIGQTNNLGKRIEEHRLKKGAKYIKYFKSFELVYSEEFKSRSKAMKREAQLKKWKRSEKEALVLTDLNLLKSSSSQSYPKEIFRGGRDK